MERSPTPRVGDQVRTGRALVHVVLCRRGLTPAFVPPISLALATLSGTYVGGLTSFRHLAEPSATPAGSTP